MENVGSNNRHPKVPFGVNFIRKCILTLAIILTVSVIFELLLDFPALNIEEFLKKGLQCAIFWIIFYGIKKEKSWTVILVLICSYFALLTTILVFLNTSVINGYDLLKRLFQLILILFYVFQIVIFTRSETKRYFKEKGTIVVS